MTKVDTKFREQYVSTLCDLIRIPSRSSPDGGEEAAVQSYVAEAMREAGARVRTFEAADVPEFFDHPLCFGPHREYSNRPTVIGEMGPVDAPALLIAAHSDTVPVFEPEKWTRDPFDAHVEDGRIYGLGAGDDKSGVALLLILMRALQNQKLQKRLIFASTIDEEHGVGNGLLLLHLAGIKADAAIYLDGVDLDFFLGHMGGSHIHITPKANIAPEAMEADAIALDEACKALSKQRESLFEAPFLRQHEFRSKSVALWRVTHLGEPFLQIRFYTVEGEKPSEVLAQLNNLIETTLQERFELYSITDDRPWFEPAFTPPETPIVQHMVEAHREVRGKEPLLQRISKQDTFVLINHAGIPTLSFGLSRMEAPGAYHMPDEFSEIETAWQGLQIVHSAVCHWLEEAQ